MNTMKPLTIQEIEHQLRNMIVGENDVRPFEVFSFWVKGINTGNPVYLKSAFSVLAKTYYDDNGIQTRNYYDEWIVNRIKNLMDTYGEIYEMDITAKYDYEGN